MPNERLSYRLPGYVVPLLVFLCGCSVQRQNLPFTTSVEPDTDEGVVVIGIEPRTRVEIKRGIITDSGKWDCRRAQRVAWVWPEDGYLVLRLPELPAPEAYAITKLKEEGGDEFVAVEGTSVAVFNVRAGTASYLGSVAVRRAVQVLPWKDHLQDPTPQEPDSFRIRDLSRPLADMLPELFDDDPSSPDGSEPNPTTGLPGDHDTGTDKLPSLEHFAGRRLLMYSDWLRAKEWIAAIYPGLVDDLRSEKWKSCLPSADVAAIPYRHPWEHTPSLWTCRRIIQPSTLRS